MKLILPVCLLLTSLLATAVEPQKDPSLMPNEVKFMQTAAQSSHNEIHIAKLGELKSPNTDLKKFATTLAADHTEALTEAKSLATQKNVNLPTAIDEDAAETYKDLNQKTGSDFDKAFVTYLDKSHIKGIKSFEEAQKDCRDADLKKWIDKTLAVIKAHHEHIKKLK